jgi:hypothetical protein
MRDVELLIVLEHRALAGSPSNQRNSILASFVSCQNCAVAQDLLMRTTTCVEGDSTATRGALWFRAMAMLLRQSRSAHILLI